MRVLISTIAALLVTVSQVMAAGGNNAEPVSVLMILFMGGAVGFIVFSILMPILQMNEMVG